MWDRDRELVQKRRQVITGLEKELEFQLAPGTITVALKFGLP